MFYAIKTCYDHDELHVYPTLTSRDVDATRWTPFVREATLHDAKTCDPWSLVLHDTTLAKVQTLPKWVVGLVSKATTWFSERGNTYLCLV